jgi:hypothetical protein
MPFLYIPLALGYTIQNVHLPFLKLVVINMNHIHLGLVMFGNQDRLLGIMNSERILMEWRLRLITNLAFII